jgi:hypothetical protein
VLASLAVFALVFAAEFAASVWDGAYQTAVRKRQLRSRLLYGGLLQLLGWADYVGADRFSLLAAFPGSILGSLAGDWYGGRRAAEHDPGPAQAETEAEAGP